MSRNNLYDVPDGSTRITIWTRSSFPAPPVPEYCGERGLSIDGHKLCRSVGKDYAYVQKRLCPTFGSPTFFSAPDLISRTTCSEIFMPEAMRTETRLAQDVNLMKLNEGRWYDQQKQDGLTFGDMCEAAWNEQDAVLPDLTAQLDQLDEFFFDPELLRQIHFRICVGPESLISMFVARHDQPSDPDDTSYEYKRLGLFSCQSFFFYHTDTAIQHIVRMDPTASVQTMLARNTKRVANGS